MTKITTLLGLQGYNYYNYNNNNYYYYIISVTFKWVFEFLKLRAGIRLTEKNSSITFMELFKRADTGDYKTKFCKVYGTFQDKILNSEIFS